METKSFICEFCNSIYSSSNTLSRHRNYVCKLVPDDIKTKMLEKQSARKQKKDAVTTSVKPEQHISIDKSIKNIDQSIDQSTNVNLITFVNICGSQVPEDLLKSIKEINESSIAKLRQYIPNLLTPFGNENISHITDDSKKMIRYYKNIAEDTFKKLLNDIHKFDENRNFAVPNVKFAIVQYVNDDYDISKTDKKEHIRNIQEQMRDLYKFLFTRYKSKIPKRYHEEHELLIKHMMRKYAEVVDEFNLMEELAKEEEIDKCKKEPAENDEDFDERDIINRTPRICHIPDYNTITLSIIETYLTTNSRANMELMRQHKDKVFALKNAIGPKEPKKFKTLRDLKEEDRLAELQKQAEGRILESAN